LFTSINWPKAVIDRTLYIRSFVNSFEGFASCVYVRYLKIIKFNIDVWTIWRWRGVREELDLFRMNEFW